MYVVSFMVYYMCIQKLTNCVTTTTHANVKWYKLHSFRVYPLLFWAPSSCIIYYEYPYKFGHCIQPILNTFDTLSFWQLLILYSAIFRLHLNLKLKLVFKCIFKTLPLFVYDLSIQSFFLIPPLK